VLNLAKSLASIRGSGSSCPRRRRSRSPALLSYPLRKRNPDTNRDHYDRGTSGLIIFTSTKQIKIIN
jgi:hypothetical protein